MSLDALLQRADIWRGGEYALRAPTGPAVGAVATGCRALDEQLPDGGWPLGTLVEILLQQHGIGELQLLLPALAQLSRQSRWLVWVTPPHLPYAPALARAGIDLSRLLLIRHQDPPQQYWALEQSLRSGACGVALSWLHNPDPRVLRRLQLAARTGHALGVLFRPQAASRQPSPAALRLRLEPSAEGLIVHILKRRGGWSRRPLLVPIDHALA